MLTREQKINKVCQAVQYLSDDSLDKLMSLNFKDGDAIVSSYFPSKDMTDKTRKAIDEAYASGFVGPFETAEEAMKFLLK